MGIAQQAQMHPISFFSLHFGHTTLPLGWNRGHYSPPLLNLFEEEKFEDVIEAEGREEE